MSPPSPLINLNAILETLEPDRAERLSWLADRIYHECHSEEGKGD
jgi:hypothetical protein